MWTLSSRRATKASMRQSTSNQPRRLPELCSPALVRLGKNQIDDDGRARMKHEAVKRVLGGVSAKVVCSHSSSLSLMDYFQALHSMVLIIQLSKAGYLSLLGKKVRVISG